MFSLLIEVVSQLSIFLIVCRWNLSILLISGSFNCSESVPYINFDFTIASTAMILKAVGQLFFLQNICSFCNVL